MSRRRPPWPSIWRLTALPGAGRRYMIQHSAGSGKFDSIIVVTDRRILDQQIRDIIRFVVG